VYDSATFSLPAIQNTAQFQFEIVPRDALPGFITWDREALELTVDSLSFLNAQGGGRLLAEETDYFYEEPVWMQWNLLSNSVADSQLGKMTGLSQAMDVDDFNSEFYFDVKIEGLDMGLKMQKDGFLFTGDDMKEQQTTLNGTAPAF